MIYITQFIFIRENQEKNFNDFEKTAIPFIARYHGNLLLRIRPDKQSMIDGILKQPYEIHLINFQSDEDFENFMLDEERKKILHLKEKSIRKIILIKGNEI
jgi:uncharacterized protein (DUF1330 family)